MSGCEYFQELISRKLDEALSREEEAALAEHLQTCEECSFVHSAFLGVSEMIDEGLEEAPETLKINVMAELRRQDIVKKNRKKRAFRPLIAAAACLVLVLAAGLATGRGLNRAATEAAPAAIEPAAAAPAEKNMALPEAADAAEITVESAAAEESPAEPAEYDTAVSRFSLPAPQAETVEEAAADEAVLHTWDELAAVLAGTESSLSLEDIAGEPVLTLSFSLEGAPASLCIYAFEDALYYTDPITGKIMLAGCNVELLTIFVS